MRGGRLESYRRWRRRRWSARRERGEKGRGGEGGDRVLEKRREKGREGNVFKPQTPRQ